MTVSSTTVFEEFTGDGSTTTFSPTFLIFDEAHIEVYVAGTLQTLNSDYTVANIGDPPTAGFDVDFTVSAAPANGVNIIVRRVVPLTQEADYIANSAFPAETQERGLDLLAMALQQVQEQLDRAALLALGTPTSGLVLPEPEADKVLGWNAGGMALENKDAAGGGATDHGALTGLSDDDHTQYLLVAGTRAMTGSLNMGGNAVTNVGNVDGRDVSADGTKLDGVEAGAQVNDVDSVHGRTGAVVGDSGDYDADQITETVSNKIMTAAERTKLAGIEAGAEVNDVDTVHGRTGAVVGAAGDYDDSQIDAAATAANYTPTAATVEGHLAGIDTALASAGGGTGVLSMRLTPQGAVPVNTNFATQDTIDDGAQVHSVLDFDPTTEEAATWQTTLDRNYAGAGLTFTIHGAMDSANTGTKAVRIGIAIEKQTGALGTASFAAEKTVDLTVDNTANNLFSGTLAFTDGAEIDSIAAGDPIRIKVARKAGAVADDAVGDFQLVAIDIKDT